jgi:hypothetical protein
MEGYKNELIILLQKHLYNQSTICDAKLEKISSVPGC